MQVNGKTYRQDATGQWFVWTNEGTLLNCWGWLATAEPVANMPNAISAENARVAEDAARCLRGLGWLARVSFMLGCRPVVHSNAPEAIVVARIREFSAGVEPNLPLGSTWYNAKGERVNVQGSDRAYIAEG